MIQSIHAYSVLLLSSNNTKQTRINCIHPHFLLLSLSSCCKIEKNAHTKQKINGKHEKTKTQVTGAKNLWTPLAIKLSGSVGVAPTKL